MVFGWFIWFFKVVSWFFMVFGWFTCFSWLLVVFSWFSLSWQTLCRQVLHNMDRAQSEAAKTFRRGRLDEDELTARTYNLLSTSVPTTENTKRWAYNNQEIFLVYFWSYIMIVCVLKRILHKKKSIFMQLLESPIPPLTAAALRMIICRRPAPHFDNHEKGMKDAFLRPFIMR